MEAFIFLAKSMAILSIFYIVYFLFFRKETLFVAKRYFFLAGIVASVILPFVEFTKHLYIEQSSILSSGQLLGLPNNVEVVSIETPFDWWYVVGAVYGIGLIVFVIRFVIELLSLRKVINKFPSTKQGKYLFVEMRERISPFSFFYYIIYNPDQHEKDELNMILQHEKVHASQRHSIDLILVNLVRAIQWINPLAWLYKKSLEENLEFIADFETVAQLTSRKQYQLTLLKNLSPIGAPALTSQFYQSIIKKRIIMLNKNASKKRNVWKLSFVLPFLCIFLWSFNVKEELHYEMSASGMDEVLDTFTILPNSTDQELDLIESYFETNAVPAKIKISNRRRDKNGLINAFEFKTKFRNEDRYYKRFSVNGNTKFTYKGHNIQYNEGGISVSELGPKPTSFRITKEMLRFIDF